MTIWIFLGFCATFSTLCSSFYSFPAGELQALKTLYDSTDGENWIWFTPYSLSGIPWNFTAVNETYNPCSAKWQGIACSSNCQGYPCFTIEIFLIENNMMGQLPNIFQAFFLLASLVLEQNLLSGNLLAIRFTQSNHFKIHFYNSFNRYNS